MLSPHDILHFLIVGLVVLHIRESSFVVLDAMWLASFTVMSVESSF